MKNMREKEIRKLVSSPNVNFASGGRSWKPRVIDTPEQAKAIGRKMAADIARKLKLKLTV